MDELHSLLLGLYRCAREAPFDDFQRQALLLLQRAIPFDVARWGTGVVDSQGLVFHDPYLHNDSAESLKDYTDVREYDDVAIFCIKHPGITLNCYLPDQCTRSRDLKAYAHRYRHEHGLVTGFINPVTGHAASISLYGAYERKPFSEGQRSLMQIAFPHFQEALGVSQRLQAERFREIDQGGRWGIAVADSGGLICIAEPAFVRTIQAEWPGASESVVPQPLFRWLLEKPHRPFSGRKTIVVPFPAKGLVFFKARAREGTCPYFCV